MSEISHVEIDGNRASVQNVQNDVKVILLDGDYQRHIKITHEGVFVDLIDPNGEVVDTLEAYFPNMEES